MVHLKCMSIRMSASKKKLFIKFSQQIAEGMKYLSGKGFIHRNLAARNVLLDHVYTCKVSLHLVASAYLSNSI